MIPSKSRLIPPDILPEVMVRQKFRKPSKRLNGYDGIPYKKLTPHQKIAKKTGGVVTGPNGLSLVGAGVSGLGAYEIVNDRPVLGAVLFAVGSSADLLDGPWARTAGVWNEKGALLDATLDRFRLVGMIGCLMYAGAVPEEFGIFKLATQAALTGVVVAGTVRGMNIRTVPSGKKNAFVTTVAAGGYATADAIHHVSSTPFAHDLALGFEVGASGAVVATGYYGALALRDYSRDAFAHKPQATEASPYAGVVTINRSELARGPLPPQ